MRTVIRGVKESGDAADRARRIAAILAAGLERLFGGGEKVGAEGETALDYDGNPSVTTDCRADGPAEESDDLGD